MRAHVICCNDSVEAVVLGDHELAKAETQRLKQEYLKRHPWFTEDEARAGYWHYHTVDLIQAELLGAEHWQKAREELIQKISACDSIWEMEGAYGDMSELPAMMNFVDYCFGAEEFDWEELIRRK